MREFRHMRAAVCVHIMYVCRGWVLPGSCMYIPRVRHVPVSVPMCVCGAKAMGTRGRRAGTGFTYIHTYVHVHAHVCSIQYPVP